MLAFDYPSFVQGLVLGSRIGPVGRYLAGRRSETGREPSPMGEGASRPTSGPVARPLLWTTSDPRGPASTRCRLEQATGAVQT